MNDQPTKTGDGVIDTHYCCQPGCKKWAALVSPAARQRASNGGAGTDLLGSKHEGSLQSSQLLQEYYSNYRPISYLPEI